MSSGRVPTVIKIQHRFRAYRKLMHDIWESYNLVDHYMQYIHNMIKKEEVETFELLHLLQNNTKKYSKKHTYGAISHLRLKANPRRSLIDSVSTFEEFMGRLCFMVYLDHPTKLAVQDKDTPLFQGKIMTIILESKDKDEMVRKLAEERIRGIFYGNPADFFLKDRARLDFKDFFERNFKVQIDQYREVLARRNVLIHNGGAVDRKYLDESNSANFRIGQMVDLSPEYLRRSIALMEGLGSASAAFIIHNTYNDTVKGELLQAWEHFKRESRVNVYF